MVNKFISLLLAVSILVVSSGCCSITRGNRQLVTITSEPTGAKVKMDGYKGTTPYSVSLDRSKDYVVEVSKEGYETEQRQVTHSFSSMAIFGNILWLLVGVIVDFATGSGYNLNPTNVNVELEKAK